MPMAIALFAFLNLRRHRIDEREPAVQPASTAREVATDPGTT